LEQLVIELAIVFGLYVLFSAWQAWRQEARYRRLEAEARLERRELTDRIMALSSKPESLAAIHQDYEEATLKVVGEDKSWREDRG
jgi:hypothetical protein